MSYQDYRAYFGKIGSCVKIYRDFLRRIKGYEIEFNDIPAIRISAEDLKVMISAGFIKIRNLKLTSDRRLIQIYEETTNIDRDKVCFLNKGLLSKIDYLPEGGTYIFKTLTNEDLEKAENANAKAAILKIDFRIVQLLPDIYLIAKENHYIVGALNKKWYMSETELNAGEQFVENINSQGWFNKLDPKSVDISDVNTSLLTNMSGIFYGCDSMTNVKLGKMNTENVTCMRGMFALCNNLESLDISSFNTSKVKDMSYMFEKCESLRELNISKFDTSSLEDAGHMFDSAGMEVLDISGFKSNKLTNIERMFHGMENIKELNITSLTNGHYSTLNGLFGYCSNLKKIIFGNLNTCDVVNMSGMFNSCAELTRLDITRFKTSKVTDMSGMFGGCKKLSELGLNMDGLDLSNVRDMNYMFEGSGVKNVNLGKFRLNSVETLRGTFRSCDKLESIDLGANRMPKLVTMYKVCAGCKSLKAFIAPHMSPKNYVHTAYAFEDTKMLDKLMVKDIRGYDKDWYSCFFGARKPSVLVTNSVGLKLAALDTTKKSDYDGIDNLKRIDKGLTS